MKNNPIPAILMIVLIAALSGGCSLMNTSAATDPAPAEPQFSAARHMELAQGMINSGRPESALAHYDRALEQEPDNLDARILRARALLDKGEQEKALKDYVYVLGKEPGNSLANQGVGVISFKTGLMDRAEERFERAVMSDPGLWRSHAYLGLIDNQRGHPVDAAAHFSAACQLRPRDADLLNNLGVAQVMSKDLDGAMVSFTRAIHAGGAGDTVYNNLGMVLVRMNHLPQALQAFMNASDEAKAHNNLGYALILLSRYDEAVPYLEKAIELSPTFYHKAFENLKRARMAAGLAKAGRTPVPGGPDMGVIPVEPAKAPIPAPAVPSPESAPAPLTKPLFTPASFSPAPMQSPQVSIAPEPVRALQSRPSGVAFAPRLPETEDVWAIHVSSWRTEDKATRMAARLADLGLEPLIQPIDVPGSGQWFRLLAGRYDSKPHAVVDRPRVLDRLGLDKAFIFKVPVRVEAPAGEGPTVI